MEGGVGARSTFVDEEVRVTSARLNGFVVNELAFPPSHSSWLEPEREGDRELAELFRRM